MFNSRLVRESDALLCFETIAFLTRRIGAPGRPSVPSPLHKSQGIETLIWDQQDQRTVMDWADDSFALILQDMNLPSDDIRLAPSVRQTGSHPGLVGFDPAWCGQRGQFTTRVVMALVEPYLKGLDFDEDLGRYQDSVVLLSACAHFRQGFTLCNLLPNVGEALDERYGEAVPARLIENALTFSACLSLMVHRQSPEQITATYGRTLTKSVRKKITAACRQIEEFESELKLLRVISEAGQPARRQGFHSGRAQPQRISWT